MAAAQAGFPWLPEGCNADSKTAMPSECLVDSLSNAAEEAAETGASAGLDNSATLPDPRGVNWSGPSAGLGAKSDLTERLRPFFRQILAVKAQNAEKLGFQDCPKRLRLE
ncbi:unnamed protein product [Protopolystoma xenopodis]|uniref:Uncharacterized protein n=1 Tax=Protopolystoma xenopodis TaxID=117903 RepID=A0A3S5AHN3_9PLAT|nr:unnamed protein product [Protopolystoma xenopodis]